MIHRFCGSYRALACTVTSGLLFLLILCPLFGLFTDLAYALLSGTVTGTAAGIFSLRRMGLLAASIGLSLAVAAAGMGIGILIATLLWRAPKKAGGIVLMLLLALAAVPLYIHALTWSAALGSLNRYLPFFIPTGWLVSFWVELMALLPLSVFLAWIAFASVDIPLIDTGRVFRPDMTVFTKIVLPLAMPALGAAFGFLFLLCCTDYSVPSLFGIDVYALEIFAQFSATNSPAQALLYALPLLAVTVCVMLACRSGIRTLAQTPGWLSARWGNPPVFPRWFRCMQGCAAAIVIIQVIMLFSGLIITTGSFSAFAGSVMMSAGELGYSVLIAACVVLVSLPLALAAAYELKTPGFWGSLAWVFVLLPLAIPAPLIGIGMITFFTLPGVSLVYPGTLMPVLVSVVRFAPFAAIILFVQIRFINPLLFEAADVFSKSCVKSWTRVRLPLLAPGILVSAGVLAALAIAELGATLIVVPPGCGTLTMRIYNYLHYGAAEEVAGLCLMITILALAAGACAILAIRRLYRHTPAPYDPKSGDVP